MIKSLVKYGGVLGILLILGCSGSPPALDIDPDPTRIYPGYKGGAARDGFAISDKSTGISPLWQLKFRYPLFDSPSIACDYIFLPGIDKKIHVIEVNTGVEIAEIKLRRPIGATPELADSFMAICEEGPKATLLVINYISGELIWKVNTFKLCLPPALFDKKIFWVDGKNRINAAWLNSGEQIWSIELENGFDAGPVITNDLLFIAARDKHIYCFDIADGSIVWEKIGPGRTNSSPACFDDKLFFCMANGKIVCYACSDGKLLWSHDDKPRIFYSPSIDEAGVYYGTGDGRFVKLDKNNGHELWKYKIDTPIRGTALVTSKSVIFSSLDNTVYILDKMSGKVLESYVANGMISAAPVLFDDKLYIAAQDKFLYCFNMKGEK